MTKDELENELTGTRAMLSATEANVSRLEVALEETQTEQKRLETSNKLLADKNMNLLDQLQALEANALDFDFLLRQGLQLDYDMRTLRYRASISQYVLQNHRKIEYVEGRGNGAAETNFNNAADALQAFVKGV